MKELKVMWPQLTIVHGRPRHPQSQGSVERANGDIKDMLISWMSDTSSQDVTVGIKFVQQMKNVSYHAGIKRNPYTAMFGTETKVGLTSSSIPLEIIERLESEEDLLRAISAPQPQDQLPGGSQPDNVTPEDVTPSQLDDQLPGVFQPDDQLPGGSQPDD
ncbi:hypothetical protein ACOMHN_042524 [Nucella lapillus]